MKKALLLIVLINLILLSNAQKDLRKGYIITNSNDTLQGMINFKGDMQNSVQCEFYADENTNKVYYPFEIKGYRFIDGKYYVSKNVEEDSINHKIFAEYLVSGRKDLFYFRDPSGYHYMLTKNENTLIVMPHKEEIVKIKGKDYLPEPTRHIGYLKAYFSDCPEIFDEIEQIQYPDTKKLIAVTKDYHDRVCGENSCIIYRKIKPKIKMGIEPKFELMQFKGDSEYNDLRGGLVYLWLPEANENLFLKTGFIYGKYLSSYSMFKLPLQFEYLYPGKIVRPKMNIGINYYRFKYLKQKEFQPENLYQNLTFAAGGGFMFLIVKDFYIDANVETDIFTFTFSDGVFLDYTLGLGVLLIL